VWLDVRSAGTAFKAGDLVAQRGNCSLQLSYHFKLTYDQALQLGVGQAVKIRRRNHCQNESDSRQSVNLKIIPSPLLLPILLRMALSNCTIRKLSTPAYSTGASTFMHSETWRRIQMTSLSPYRATTRRTSKLLFMPSLRTFTTSRNVMRNSKPDW